MKQCPNCGSSIEERVMVCNNCGVKFSGDGDRRGRQSRQGQNRQPRGQNQQPPQGQNRQPRGQNQQPPQGQNRQPQGQNQQPPQGQNRQPQGQNQQPPQGQNQQPQGEAGRGQQAAGAQSGTSQTLSDRIASLGITRIATLAAGILLLIAATFLPWVTGDGQLSASATETEFGDTLLIAGGAVLGFSAVRWGRGIGWITMLLSGVAGAGAIYISVAAQQALSATRTAPFQVVIVRGSRVPIGAVEPGVGVFAAIVAGGLAVVGSLFGIIDSLTNY